MIDPQTRQVLLNGRDLQFTRKEFDLLFCLAATPDRFSAGRSSTTVWDEHAAYNVDDVEKAQIKLLRQKLSGTGRDYIKNVWA